MDLSSTRSLLHRHPCAGACLILQTSPLWRLKATLAWLMVLGQDQQLVLDAAQSVQVRRGMLGWGAKSGGP